MKRVCVSLSVRGRILERDDGGRGPEIGGLLGDVVFLSSSMIHFTVSQNM